MQELIKQGMGQKLEKSCFRCKKNTWHLESIYILQPRTFYCNDSKITELEMIDTKNSSTSYVVMYELIT